MKTVHAYNPTTRVYVGTLDLDDGDISPLEPEKYLIPGNCLEAVPPEPVEGQEIYATATGTWAQRPVPVAPPTVPLQVRTVTMRQARLALLAAGHLTAVAEAIAGLPSPQREAAQIEWEFAATVERDSTAVALLGSSLELDAEAIDQLFKEASAL